MQVTTQMDAGTSLPQVGNSNAAKSPAPPRLKTLLEFVAWIVLEHRQGPQHPQEEAQQLGHNPGTAPPIRSVARWCTTQHVFECPRTAERMESSQDVGIMLENLDLPVNGGWHTLSKVDCRSKNHEQRVCCHCFWPLRNWSFTQPSLLAHRLIILYLTCPGLCFFWVSWALWAAHQTCMVCQPQ